MYGAAQLTSLHMPIHIKPSEMPVIPNFLLLKLNMELLARILACCFWSWDMPDM